MERNKLDFIKQKLESHVQYTDRINKELDILVDLDCFDKFYDMYENIINNKSKIGNKNEINSICAFLLGMTTKEPDKEFNIPKRRTYARDGFPDIDMDFDHLRRHEIVDYLINKYGRDYISNIGTVQILQPKSALRRAIKVLDPGNFVKYDNGVKVKSDNNESFQLENEILNTLPKHMKLDDGTLIKSLKFAYDNLPSFKRYMDIYPEVYNLAVRLEGTVASMGVHAAGVLLSPEPMKQIAPLHITKGEDISADDDTDKGKILTATQFSMKDVESLGLIKFDVLGLSTKSSISLTKKIIKERHGIDIDLSSLPLDDKRVYKTISSGNIVACFQLDGSRGMKEAVMEIGVDSFDDLQAVIAMYRPGPMQYISLYARRKKE